MTIPQHALSAYSQAQLAALKARANLGPDQAPSIVRHRAANAQPSGLRRKSTDRGGKSTDHPRITRHMLLHVLHVEQSTGSKSGGSSLRQPASASA